MRTKDKNNTIQSANKRLEESFVNEKINEGDAATKDVQKFVEKIKSLESLVMLKDKLNTKQERILGVKAIAELFELSDVELTKAAQSLRTMDGV